MRFNYQILLALSFATLFFACKKDDIQALDLKDSYYPLQIGKYIIYDVDSTVYDDFTQTSYKHQFQVKMLVADTFRDSNMKLNYRYERYIRKNATQTFQLADVWSAINENGRIEVVEENQRFIKFIYPPVLGNSWKGNAFIKADLSDPRSKFLGNWDYSFTAVDEPFDLNGTHYDSTTVVLENGELIPQVQSSNFKTIYAKHIGPIYAKREFVEKQPSDLTWQSGFSVEYRINSHN
jgi:hypothetical protein